MSFASHDHRPFSSVGWLWSLELNVELYDLERLQDEVRNGCLLEYLRLWGGGSKGMSSASVGLSLDDFKRSVNVELKLHVSFRVIRKDQLGDLLRCLREVSSTSRPVFDVEVLVSVHLD